jgi:hypothetical protein
MFDEDAWNPLNKVVISRRRIRNLENQGLLKIKEERSQIRANEWAKQTE